MLVLEDSSGVDNAHRTGLAVDRTYAVSCLQLVLVPSLDRTGVTVTLRHTCYVDLLACGEGIGCNDVANVYCAAIVKTEFLEVSLKRNACLVEVTFLSLGEVLFLSIYETELNGVITVFLCGLFLCYYTGTCLDDCYRDYVTLCQFRRNISFIFIN